MMFWAVVQSVLPVSSGADEVGGRGLVSQAMVSASADEAGKAPENNLKTAEMSRIEKENETLRTILAGGIPEGVQLDGIIGCDLRDDGAVRKKTKDLEAALSGISGEHDGKTPTGESSLQRKRDELILDILRLPSSKRKMIIEKIEAGRITAMKSQLASLQTEIEALTQLVKGTLPEQFEITNLFEVDLENADDVTERVTFLKKRLGADAAVSKGPAGKPLNNPETYADLKAAIQWGMIERDRLRLRFLELPLEKRIQLIEAGSKLNRISDDKKAAEKALNDAILAESSAEVARVAALAESQAASSEAKKAIAAERARLEQARSALAGYRRQLADKRLELSANAQKSINTIDSLRKKAADNRSHPAADKLYDDIVTALIGQRKYFKEALRYYTSDIPVSYYKSELDLQSASYQESASEKEELVGSIQEMNHEAALLVEEEKKARWLYLSELADDVRLLNDLRIEIIPSLSSSKQTVILGITREGVAQAFREIEQLRLMSTYYVYRAAIARKELVPGLTDVFTLGLMGSTLIQILLLLFAALYLKRYAPAIFQKAHASILTAASLPHGFRMSLDRGFDFAQAVGRDLGRLVFVYLLFGLIGGNGAIEIDVVRVIAVSYAWYRLVLTVPFHLITRSVSSRRIRMSPEISSRILVSIRLVLRYVFAIIVFLNLSVRFLGKGYLFNVTVNFSWLGLIPILLILIFRWRDDLTAYYLQNFPQGAFAGIARGFSDHRLGFLVVVPVFFVLLMKWIRVYFAYLFSFFKISRKILAYLFRRQLEKHSKTYDDDIDPMTTLPRGLVDAFSEAPVDKELEIRHFPHIDTATGIVDEWKKGESGGAIAVVGEAGVGKTSWLNELEFRIAPETVIRGEIDRDVHTEKDICRTLKGILGFDSGDSISEVAAALLAGPRRIVLLDQCQNVVLRAVDGMKGFLAFTEIVSRTEHHMVWVCSFSRYAWEYVESVTGHPFYFREILHLKPWGQKAMDEMIAKRMAATGYQVTYEDLIVERLDGTEFENEVIRTGERYRQLLLDYADGLPRVALHFWIRSLIPAEGKLLKVRLFKDPSADSLEQLPEHIRFLLGAVVMHENLTVEDAARVLNYTRKNCEYALRFLCARRILEEREGGRYKVSSHWHRAVIRYLRRKHILYS
jgi:hypothetical protein